MAFEPFMNGDFRVIANVPRAIREGSSGKVFDDGVKYYALAADGHQIGVSI